MKFVVSRTSELCSNEKAPCKEAKYDEIIRVETRRLHSPEEFDKKFSKFEGKWFDIGTNHRLNKEGYIVRDRVTNVWTIELSSLDDLMAFIDKYEEVLITPCINNPLYKEIEICDIYR